MNRSRGAQDSNETKTVKLLIEEQAIYRDEGDSLRFSYPADHPLAAEFDERMVRLVREYKGDGKYLSAASPG